MKRVVLVVLGTLLCCGIFATGARAQAAPCCSITAIDAKTGVVSAKVNATGATFQFKVNDAAALKSLRVGQGVYANLGAKQVSLDGKSIAGTIVVLQAAAPALAPAAPHPAAASVAPPATPCCSITAIDAQTGIVSARVNTTGATFQFRVDDPAALKGLQVGQGVYANLNGKQVSLDGKSISGTIVASAPATSKPGAAASPVPGLAASSGPALTAKPGIPTPTASMAAAGTSPRLSPAADANAASPAGAAHTMAPSTAKAGRSAAGSLPVITLAAGTPQQATPALTPSANAPRFEAKTFAASMNGNSMTAHLVHLHGLDGIEQAQGLPDGVKELLMMHVKTLEPGEIDDYIVNLDLANEWSKTHPVSAAVKQAAEEKDSHTGCKSFSMHCAGEVEEHAEGQAEDLIKDAQNDWNNAAKQLGHDWDIAADQVEACFADKVTNPVVIPVEFSKSFPGLIKLDSSYANTVQNAVNVISQVNSGVQSGESLEQSGQQTALNNLPNSSSSSNSSNSGQTPKSPFSESMQGTITFGIPLLQASPPTAVRADFSYIPCLAFMVRPHSVGLSGTLKVETALTSNLKVTGQYDQTFPLPSIDMSIPIQEWPIVVPPAGPPVLEMDLALFVQGYLEVTAKGTLTGSANLDYAHTTSFDFTCDGKGCKQDPIQKAQSQLTKAPSTPQAAPPNATSNTQVSAEVMIQPKLFTGLELNVEFKTLQARVGPEAIMEGDVQADGCLTTTATPSGESRTASDALLAELGWTPWMRADTLVLFKQVGDGWNQPIGAEQWLGFQDLLQSSGGSTALTPAVSAGQKNVSTGQSAIYNIKMPACYPYTDAVNYKVTWTGDSTPTVNSAGAAPGTNGPCSSIGNGEATCTFDPKQNLTMAFVWPRADTYTLTVQLVGDTKGREFSSAKPAAMSIDVAAN